MQDAQSFCGLRLRSQDVRFQDTETPRPLRASACVLREGRVSQGTRGLQIAMADVDRDLVAQGLRRRRRMTSDTGSDICETEKKYALSPA